MVYLNPTGTTVQEKTHPHTYAWDVSMRKYQRAYQDLIAQQTYRLQRGVSGLALLGNWNFPSRYQNRYLLLELYQKKQLLGEVREDEIARYSAKHPNIRQDLSRVFNGWIKHLYPGLGVAAGVNVFGLVTNMNWTYRLSATFSALLLNFMWNRMCVKPYFNTVQFVDWCIQDRTAKSRVELDTNGVRKFMTAHNDYFKPLVDKEGVLDIEQAFDEFIQLK